MADRWVSVTGNSSFRFFSPEQIDQILREGARRGRTGSHDAIERILKHEPCLGRAELWRRIRRLKQPSDRKLHQRTAWRPEDDEILRKGYGRGGKENETRCANSSGDIPAGSLTRSGGGQPRSDLFLRLPEKTDSVPGSRGPKMTTEVCSLWQGTRQQSSSAKSYIGPETAIRYRLAVLGKSSRVHLEGYARRTLARSCIWAAAQSNA